MTDRLECEGACLLDKTCRGRVRPRLVRDHDDLEMDAVRFNLCTEGVEIEKGLGYVVQDVARGEGGERD